jgi:16S rRNA (uracil1498-N3)-methyltransferase
MPRIFLPEASSDTGRITITGEKAHYISAVLRCRNGDRIFISDAKGNTYTSEIISASQKSVTLAIKHVSDGPAAESPLQITLLQGLLKGAKMDLVVQKATELGVRSIVPVITERSQLRATRKLPRWRKIAEEASRVVGRSFIPEICGTAQFERLVSGTHAEPVQNGILFWEGGGKALSGVTAGMRNSTTISVFVGPEGGFSQQEAALASDNGIVICTLGKRMLRAETAAISVLAILQYALGDMGDPETMTEK